MHAAGADACSCAGPGPPCEAAWQVSAVFLGRVVSIEPSGQAESGYGGRRVEFTVLEAYRGIQSVQVRVLTGFGQGDCGYPFKVGEAYVVEAEQAVSEGGATAKEFSQVVELRFFGGLTVEETADVLKVSPETVMRDWKTAKAWLLRELSRNTRDEGQSV
jgi:hypothetical protein